MSTLPENIQNLIKSTLQKNKFKYESKVRRDIQAISIKFNPQNKFEKKSIKFNELVQVST